MWQDRPRTTVSAIEPDQKRDSTELCGWVRAPADLAAQMEEYRKVGTDQGPFYGL